MQRDRGRRHRETALRFVEFFARQRPKLGRGRDDPGARAARIEILPARAMTRRDVGREQSRRRAGPKRQRREHAGQRESEPGRRMHARRIEDGASRRDLRRQPQPRAFALLGISLEGDQVEILLRRDLLQPRVEHRLRPCAGQRERLEGCAERERDRAAGRFPVALGVDDSAPPGEPDRRKIGVASANSGLTDFIVEARQRQKPVARARARVEGA